MNNSLHVVLFIYLFACACLCMHVCKYKLKHTFSNKKKQTIPVDDAASTIRTSKLDINVPYSEVCI